MTDKTKIEWTDATWNPIRGCSRVSPGCMNCYAEGVARRFKGPGGAYEGLINKHGSWNGNIRFVDHVLTQPLRWQKPRRIFVNSMSDLFHENVTDMQITRIFDVMERAQHHTFQVLTKRPQRMLDFVSRREANWQEYARKFDKCPTEEMRNSPAAADARRRAAKPPANIWLGVSVENQEAADERIPLLLQTPAAIRFLSCEPLLGPIKFRDYTLLDRHCFVCRIEDANAQTRGTLSHPINCAYRKAFPADQSEPEGIAWVIVGGESGPGARPMHPDWARSLRDQCQAADVAFFFKQWGEYWPNCMLNEDGSRDESTMWMDHIGKRKAGRVLDGRTWDEYPEVNHG